MAVTNEHILILPKWYPNANDLQNGIFIKQYAEELSNTKLVSVIFAVPIDKWNSKIEINKTDRLLEITVPYKPSKLPLFILRKYSNYKRYMDAMKRGASALLEHRKKPDLIHVHVLIRPAMYAAHLAQMWSIPWVLTEHSSDFLNKEFVNKKGVKRWFIKHLAKRSYGISAVSQSLANGMKTIGIKQQIEIIPNLILFPKEQQSSVNNQQLQIASIADLVDEVKNISGVLRALALIKSQLPDFQYNIVGDGPDLEMLKHLTIELNLENSVVFHGRKSHDSVLDYLFTIDFLITNSRFETFSIVTAEAIACGKPVIVTRCGGPEDWFKPEYGLLVPVNDDVVLANEILKMASGFRAFSAARMSEQIRVQFSKESILERYESLYTQAFKR